MALTRQRKVTPEIEAQIRKEYEAGASTPYLAEKYKMSRPTVGYSIQNAGGSLRGRGGHISSPITGFANDEMLVREVHAEYENGKSLKVIKQERNLSAHESMILSSFRKYGLAVRNCGTVPTVEAYIDNQGYRRVRINIEDPMWSMALSGYYGDNRRTATILEHRLVMARKIGRPLREEETVHHINNNKLDNRPENLELHVGNHGKGATQAHCHTCTCFNGSQNI
jgi:hypothetical protein